MPEKESQNRKFTTIVIGERFLAVAVGDAVEIDYHDPQFKKKMTAKGTVTDVDGKIYGIELSGGRIFASHIIVDVRVVKNKRKKKK